MAADGRKKKNMLVYRFADTRDGFLRPAYTVDPKILYKALVRSYQADKLPSWATPKLVAMANAESKRRKAEKMLEQTPFGDAQRKAVLAEIRQWQMVYDGLEKSVRDYLTRKPKEMSAEDARFEEASSALDNSAIGKRMKAARGE